MKVYNYTTMNGQTVVLDERDGYNISRWYRETCLADYIMECPEFGISDEKEALEIAADALDIIEDSDVFEENKHYAIEAAVEKNKGE